ncbi:MAG: hypothetical protein MJ062_07915 [Oscillospiraceae bacterium]|nr:hypothetical protein [Oscillospiraceae bacterium]
MSQFVIRISAVSQMCEPLELQELSEQTLCELLDTDVTERLRVPEAPPFLQDAPDRVLCYLIDARGGEKSLPTNLCGTCFYHTGCPVYGDLVLVMCSRNEADTSLFGFTKAQSEALIRWLAEQFSFLQFQHI